MTEYHNAVWAGLANGLCATPFWWEYWPEPPVDPLRLIRDERWQTFNRRMASFNESVLGGPLLHLHRFVAEIDFAGQSWHDAEVSVEGCDGWAKRGDKQTFGWIVHLQQSVAGRKIMIQGLPDGTYEVRFYRTWTGKFLESQQAECQKGEITFTVPHWTRADDPDTTQPDRDVAFLLTPSPCAVRKPIGPR